MRLIARDSGRVAQSFVWEEVRPLFDIYFPTLINALGARYEFTDRCEKAPMSSHGAQFRNGHIRVGERDVPITEIDLQTENITVVARETADAELVMNDLIDWMETTFQLQKPKTIFSRRYSSALVVEFDCPLREVFQKFDDLTTLMSEALEQDYGWQGKIDVWKIGFQADPGVEKLGDTRFQFERRANIGYENERYLSVAPIRTETHITCLEQIEHSFCKVVPALNLRASILVP